MWRHGNPPPDYVITEAKYDTSRLGMTKDGRQMSDKWIMEKNRLRKAVGKAEAGRIIRAMRLNSVEKRLHTVNPAGKLVETILL